MEQLRSLMLSGTAASLLLMSLGCHNAPAGDRAEPEPGDDGPAVAPAAADGSTPAVAEAGRGLPADATAASPALDGAMASDAPGSVDVSPTGPVDAAVPQPGARQLVAGLSLARFRDNIKTLSAFGDRTQGSPSFDAAAAWLEKQLMVLGYTVEHHDYTFAGGPRRSLYVTKVGGKSPDQMYIVSAHLDGRGGGGGADDDGSGVSAVLELARALAPATVETDVSVRCIFWNNEETGLNGSHAYVQDRARLQGMESPPGSHHYPEPRWLGMIQHDMILFDHGLPPGSSQAPNADIDIEYQASSRFANLASTLAGTFANRSYAKDYPTQVGQNMQATDSDSFEQFTPSISVREDQRITEIDKGSNPQHHQPTDVYATYSDADFHLGFAITQTTVGTVGELAGATVK
jgi:hypothetical protein